ncbi:putative ABC transport system permease protein [Brachybacterium muris]|uniref:ABC transporter permease n=1 Tax=Brachybacterium muris TaxID=219301 RepID=UPI00195EAC00|nr:ABC transporter permease [Brachybacterium muris]MBM7502536.1 putative ABC transport system permease protein [Brachybacterium muris]MCT1429631.1 ABC transporter permease [Brachybacterium muris]MCT2296710.1 ABC transporter permease [Brachybacterium muris]
MFLALRELRFARGRFGLMGAVIALIAILMVMLSGLSAGLVNDGVSGLKKLPVTAFAFDQGTKTDNAFSRSVVDSEQITAWKDRPDVELAEPVGAGMINVTTTDGTQADLSLFGIEPGSALEPELSVGHGLGAPHEVVLSETARSEGIEIGTVLTVDRMDTELTVVGFTDGQATFGHVDIMYLPLDTWRLLISGQAQPGAPTAEQLDALDSDTASVVALQAADDEIDLAAGDAAATTTAMPLEESFNASPGYQAETLTLSMIQWFLYAICALVIGAFFTVWTIQRTQELAVLRAIGASGGYLLRDSLAQAALLLVIFTGVGVGAGILLGNAMPEGMPFSLEPAPIAVATAVTIACGLAGATISVLRVLRIEPVTALGGNR